MQITRTLSGRSGKCQDLKEGTHRCQDCLLEVVWTTVVPMLMGTRMTEAWRHTVAVVRYNWTHRIAGVDCCSHSGHGNGTWSTIITRIEGTAAAAAQAVVVMAVGSSIADISKTTQRIYLQHPPGPLRGPWTAWTKVLGPRVGLRGKGVGASPKSLPWTKPLAGRAAPKSIT